jgi:hypothetical protein
MHKKRYAQIFNLGWDRRLVNRSLDCRFAIPIEEDRRLGEVNALP